MNPGPAPNRTGVIVGLDRTTTQEEAFRISEELTIQFPGVIIAVVGGADSVAFTFYDPYPASEGERS